MNIRLIVVGNVKEEFYRKKTEQFLMALNKRHRVELIELKDESIPKNAGDSVLSSILEREGERILSHITNIDYVIALCIDGKAVDGEKLRKIMQHGADIKSGSVTFVIGGSLGLSREVEKRADYKLSFSKMTFPHQLMRVMLMEQLSIYL